MKRRASLFRTCVFLTILGLLPIAVAKEARPVPAKAEAKSAAAAPANADAKQAKPAQEKAREKAKSKEKKKAPPAVAKFVPGSWTMVLVPDVQNYSTRFPGLTRLQMQWILEHKESRQIAFVLQLGDLTNNNLPWEWKRVSRAFAMLDGVVPYAVVPGNHDYRFHGRQGRNTLINDYFSPSRFESRPGFGGTMEPGRIENSYHLFEAGGRKWLIIGLEFGPRDQALDWANGLLEKHADRKAIVFTHAYIYHDSTRYDWAAKGPNQNNNPHKFGIPGGVNDAQEMWDKVIKKRPNVVLAINGHIGGDGLGFQVSKADDGHAVNEMAVDYQRQEIGGGAWLRLLEFWPDGKTVQARSYSPLYEEYKTDEQNQFRFEVE